MILRGTISSNALGMDTSITIVTPKKEKQEPPYKVAYLLHGLKGNADSWLDNTLLSVYAEKENIVFVMPEVGRSFYMNQLNGLNYFDYISEELPSLIEKTFHVSKKREDRLIIGASMGGYGALKCGLSRPDYFGTIMAFSSALLFLKQFSLLYQNDATREEAMAVLPKSLYKDLVTSLGNDLHVKETDDLFSLAEKIPVSERPRIYMTCGDRDELVEDNRRFASSLEEMNWPITYKQGKGNHGWLFFNEALESSLRWARRNGK